MNQFQKLFFFGSIILFLSACSHKKKTFAQEQLNEQNYLMDMVHNNPGEASTVSSYNNPEFVKSRGFNGMVAHWYVNCAITYDNFENNIVPAGSEERMWIEKQSKKIDAKLKACDEQGMDVYAFTDMFVAPQSLWKKYGSEMGMQETNLHGYGGSVKNVRKPSIQSDLIKKLVVAQIEGIFSSFPTLDGLVLRFGETYLHDTPFHMGGAPVRQGDEGIKDHVTLLNILREEVCEKHNKKLFYRTWDFGWFHTKPEVYLSITNQVETHPNLIFSIKHTKGDFLRTFPFNPTLGIGKHQQIVEVQCQREYEGKGAHPNYISEAVLNGFEECKTNDGIKGIMELQSNPLYKGLWTWSRGGGWKGPYITNELWCDLNAFVLSKWAQNPNRSEEEIFNEFSTELGLTEKDAQVFHKIALLSNKGVFFGRSSMLTKINPWWIRDEFMGGLTSPEFNDQTDEAWGKTNKEFHEIIEKDLVDEIIAEKMEAVKIWIEIENLAFSISSGDEKFRDYVRVSCSYGRIKYDIICQAWEVMLRGLEAKETGKRNTQAIAKAHEKYTQLWKEFKALKADNDQCATLYKPYGFNNHYKDFHNDEGMQMAVEKYAKN